MYARAISINMPIDTLSNFGNLGPLAHNYDVRKMLKMITYIIQCRIDEMSKNDKPY